MIISMDGAGVSRERIMMKLAEFGYAIGLNAIGRVIAAERRANYRPAYPYPRRRNGFLSNNAGTYAQSGRPQMTQDDLFGGGLPNKRTPRCQHEPVDKTRFWEFDEKAAPEGQRQYLLLKRDMRRRRFIDRITVRVVILILILIFIGLGR